MAVLAVVAALLALRGQEWVMFIGGGLFRATELLTSGNRYVLSTLAVSLKVSTVSVTVSAILSTALAALLSFGGFRYRDLAVALVNTGMGLPSVAVGLLVLLLLTKDGPLGPLDLVYTPAAMVLSQVVLVLPLMTGISHAALESVSPGVREAARSLGATETQAALRVVREARFGIATSILAGFGRAISEVGGVLIVGGNIRMADGTSYTRTMTTAISVEAQKGDFEEALAFGVLLVGVVLLVALVANHLQRRAP